MQLNNTAVALATATAAAAAAVEISDNPSSSREYADVEENGALLYSHGVTSPMPSLAPTSAPATASSASVSSSSSSLSVATFSTNLNLTTAFAFATPMSASTLTSTLAPATFTNRSMVPRVSAEIPIWVIPCYSIILLFAVVGNLLVLLTLVQNRRMRTITNVFLLNLAISDILLGVLCMPVTLVGTLLRHFIFGEILCKLIQFLQAVSVAVSSWTLVAISCERYYAICHPLRSRTWQTINHANKIIAFIWIGSIICMTPIAVFSQLMPTSRQGLRKCREHWPPGSIGYERAYNIFLDLALLVFPLLVLSFTYILITRTLYVSMCNERAMIFGSSGVSAAGLNCDNVMTTGTGTGNVNLAGGSGSSGSVCYKPTKTSGTQQFFRFHQTQNNEAIIATNGAELELVYQQQQQQHHHNQQQQQQQHMGHQYYHAANGFTHGGSKRKLLTSYDGRRHLYCMRSASVKSMRHSGSDGRKGCYIGGGGVGGGPSPSPSLTLGNMPQQQRFLLQRHHQYLVEDMDGRKSLSTPSLRINTEAALRRSNESKSLESKKRVVKMLFVLVLEFFICWTPLYVINTAAMFIGPAIYEYVDYTSISFLQLLAYSSSCCNPITYCFMNASFRRAFVDTFKGMRFADGSRFFRKRSKNETNLSVAGGSIALANSVMSNHTMLESPRL